MPERVQMSRQHPWKSEHPDAIKVDRTTRWGNPFRVGKPIRVWYQTRLMLITPEDTSKAVDWFRLWLSGAVRVTGKKPPTRDEILAELGGHDLACWCAATAKCHADVLLGVANA